MKCEKCGGEVLEVKSLHVILHDEQYMVGGRCIKCGTTYQIPAKVHSRSGKYRIEDFRK